MRTPQEVQSSFDKLKTIKFTTMGVMLMLAAVTGYAIFTLIVPLFHFGTHENLVPLAITIILLTMAFVLMIGWKLLTMFEETGYICGYSEGESVPRPSRRVRSR